jgi:hypothetical protein
VGAVVAEAQAEAEKKDDEVKNQAAEGIAGEFNSCSRVIILSICLPHSLCLPHLFSLSALSYPSFSYHYHSHLSSLLLRPFYTSLHSLLLPPVHITMNNFFVSLITFLENSHHVLYTSCPLLRRDGNLHSPLLSTGQVPSQTPNAGSRIATYISPTHLRKEEDDRCESRRCFGGSFCRYGVARCSDGV